MGSASAPPISAASFSLNMPVRIRASTASGASVPSSSLRGPEARNVPLMLSTASRRNFLFVSRCFGNASVIFLRLVLLMMISPHSITTNVPGLHRNSKKTRHIRRDRMRRNHHKKNKAEENDGGVSEAARDEEKISSGCRGQHQRDVARFRSTE